ncbi:Uncharacterised protein [Klebsiella pneumoniae]|nr:Uncharacterised protein [Klebsiella pneumoniae]SSD72401.1 Uncharacterised protein [Klebsiella pneumoniae]
MSAHRFNLRCYVSKVFIHGNNRIGRNKCLLHFIQHPFRLL